MDILSIEIATFKKDMKIDPMLSFKRKNDYYFGMRKAFDDAFGQYVRRTKQNYSAKKDEYIAPVLDSIYDYLNSNSMSFDQCFDICIEKAKTILNNNSFGLAQKFVNMSFKYAMCFFDSDEIKDKFKECYLPLDKYTIKWIKSLKNKIINKKLSEIKDAWTKVDEELYYLIQDFVKNELSKNLSYTISYSKQSKDNVCTLPRERLLAEFIIWHQEKINELHRSLEKSKNDFDRLGIKQV